MKTKIRVSTKSETSHRGLLRGLCGGVLLLACLSPLAQAAGAAESVNAEPGTADSLQEVVVTAQRREERLQDVPISVSAFSQEKMEAQGLRSIDDLTRLTPGVTFQRNGVAYTSNGNDEAADINIRGIQSTAGTSTTGIYIDDTPVQSRHIGFGNQNVFPALFDLDRVEVLRGPQGTLFGAGAEGGVVRFIAPTPDLHNSSGIVRTELADTRSGDPSYELGAAAGGPIIEDVLGFRVSASFRRDGGWVDRASYTLLPNPTSPVTPTPVLARTLEANTNWQQTTTLRAALRWNINDTLSLTPSVYYQDLHINDSAAYWVSLSEPRRDAFYSGNTLPQESSDPFWLAALRLDWNLGFAQLTSNTSYFWRHQSSTSDYTQYLPETYAAFGLFPTMYPLPGDLGYSNFKDKQQNFYQEIRLASSDPAARLTWNAGVYYSHLNEDVPQSIVYPRLEQDILAYSTAQGSPTDICAPPLQCPNGLIYDGPVNRVIDRQAAVFGELALRLTRTLKITAGLRVSDVRYTGAIYQGGAFLGAPSAYSQGSGSEKPVTPKGVLAWQPDRDNLYYASASKGYRVGGVNVGVGDICDQDLGALGLPVGQNGHRLVPGSYDSDSLWSYELGAKNSFLEHSLQINSSLFLIKWSNIQQNVYLSHCGQEFTANLGQVQSRGGDIDVQYRPVHALMVELTAAYTDARYTKSSCAGTLTFNGASCGPVASAVAPVVSQDDRLVGAPWTVMFGGEYRFGPLFGLDPYLRLDYQLTTAQTALLPLQDTRNALNDVTLPGLPETRNLNVRGGIRYNGYDVSAFINNATDQHPVLFQSRDIAGSTDNLYFGRGVRPRTIGITASYHY